jgi:hypothetical protein
MTEVPKEIRAVYQELKGVLTSLKETTKDTSNSDWFDDDNFSKHVNDIIERVGLSCDIQDISNYKIDSNYLGGRNRSIIKVIPTTTKITSLLGRLDGLYSIEQPSKEYGPTFIQNQTQTQHQTISLVLNLQERILSEIPKHSDGTPERNFLEKLKSKLPSVSDVLSIISSILTIGHETGVDLETIKKLLNL